MGERSDEVTSRDLSRNSTLYDDTDSGATLHVDTDEGINDTAQLREGIEETRNELSETIEAIQDRLSPQRLKDQVKEQVRDATIGKAENMVRNAGETLSDARYGLMETIQQNPIPAAMVGIGLGWLFMNRQSGSSHRYGRYAEPGRYARDDQPYYWAQYVPGDRARSYSSEQDTPGMLNRVQEKAGEVLDQAQEKVGSLADRTQQTASNVASQAQETAGYVADQVQHQAQRVEERFQSALYENPLAVGAVALAIGTAIGFSLPQTRRENELLGEARDNLVDRAQEVAQDTIEKVQHVAEGVIDQA